MKIILSQASGGKTTKVAELAAKYTNDEKFVQIISNEVFLSDFKWYTDQTNLASEYLTYDFKTTLTEIISTIMEHPASEVVFMDGIYSSFNTLYGKKTSREELEAKIKLMKAIEDYTGKEIYVTAQANSNSNTLNGEKLIVLDYEEYLEFNK